MSDFEARMIAARNAYAELLIEAMSAAGDDAEQTAWREAEKLHEQVIRLLSADLH